MPKTYLDFGIDLPSRGQGPEKYTTCPQCSDQRKRSNKNAKCLSVNVEKECWVCHHCGWKGGLKTGGNHSQKYDHWDKAKYNTIDNWQPPAPSDTLPDFVLDWFAQRGITESTLKRNNIKYNSHYIPQLGEWVKCLQFPMMRDGVVVNIKYRYEPLGPNPPSQDKKLFCMRGGCERIFIGLDDIEPGFPTIIVEGEMDKLSLEEAGFTNVISVPDGAPNPEASNYNSKFEFLQGCEKHLEKCESFILAVDADAPGERLKEELIHRLGRERCMLVQWPDGCKDANDVLLKLGAEHLAALVYDADYPPIEGILSVEDMRLNLDKLYENGLNPGLSCGWANLENLYRVSTSQWTLVTGIPGHGKSEWLDALTINLANNHDWNFGIYSPENSPVELHVAKLIEKKMGLQFSSKDLNGMTRDEMEKGRNWVGSHFHFIDAEEETHKLETILEMGAKLVYRQGIKGLIIDPWNELDHQRPQNLSETEHISNSLTKIRKFCKKHNVHVWLVAHPTKLQRTKIVDGQSVYPVPSPYDVAGSSHFRNKAFNCIAVYRHMHDDNMPIEVHVQKIKFKKDGQVGMGMLNYDKWSGRYSDAQTFIG